MEINETQTALNLIAEKGYSNAIVDVKTYIKNPPFKDLEFWNKVLNCILKENIKN